MGRLEWIEIKNFRGIKYAKLENFTNLNIFIGKNNTGKSTVLESIYLYCTEGRQDFFEKLSIKRVLERRGHDPKLYEELHNYLFFKRLNTPIIFSGNRRELIIRHSPGIREEYEQVSKKFGTEEITCFEVSEKNKRERKERFLYRVYLTSSLQHFIFFNPKLVEEISTPKDVIFIDDGMIREVKDISTLYDYLFKVTGKAGKERIVKSIKLIEPYVEDIGLSREGVLFIFFEDFSIPITNVGDGLKMLLASTFLLNSIKNGAILYEEPENHMHPKYIEKLAEEILESSKGLNNQIFISTHSLELLEKIVRKAKEKNVHLNIYKFRELKDGNLIYDAYSLEEAYEAMGEIGMDLR